MLIIIAINALNSYNILNSILSGVSEWKKK
jgi:hypothetical protein